MSSPPFRWGTVDLCWAALGVAALLLPVDRTAVALGTTYTATPADITLGVWVLKLSLALLAIAALVLRRLSGGAVDEQAVDPPSGTTLGIVLAVLVVAVLLRAVHLDSELWMDEIFLGTRYAPLEVRQLISTYDSQNHQPLYSLLARMSFLMSGGTDWSLRVPAAVLGVASVWAVWNFGRRVTTESESVLAAALLAVSYHHVWFSQNARGYTAMLFFSLAASAIFIRLCRGSAHPRRFAWGYAVLMALAAYTHLTAAFIAIGHGAAFLATANWRTTNAWRELRWPVVAIGLSGLVAIALYAPMLPQVWREVTTPTMQGVEVEWTGAGWMVREALRVLSDGVPGGLLTVGVGVSVLGVGFVSYWRQSRLTTLVMVLPVVATLVAILAARHNLWPRFFFFAAGFFVLAALRGGFVLVRSVLRFHPDRVAVAGASVVALLSVTTVPRAWQPKQQYGAALAFVEREREPGDEVLAIDIASAVYLLRGWAPDWHRVTSLAQVRDTERIAHRTWIVYTLPARLRALMPDVYQHLQPPRYQAVRVFPAGVGGAEIHVLRHDPSTSHD